MNKQGARLPGDGRAKPAVRDVTDACRDLSELVPYVRTRLEKWMAKCLSEGLDVRISETYRSQARQEYLYSHGKTQVRSLGAHYFRVAADFFIKGGSDIYPEEKMKAAADIAKTYGFEWGGDWKSFKDTPHLQMLGGITLAEYRQGRRPKWYDWKPEDGESGGDEEDEIMTQEDFDTMMDDWLGRQSALPASGWADADWDKASHTPAADGSGLTVVDGTSPQAFVTREQLAAILVRTKAI